MHQDDDDDRIVYLTFRLLNNKNDKRTRKVISFWAANVYILSTNVLLNNQFDCYIRL